MVSLSDIRDKGKISCQYYIVWYSMVSGHGPNPIFFKKKFKNWTLKTLATPPSPHPSTSDNISFLSCTFELLTEGFDPSNG